MLTWAQIRNVNGAGGDNGVFLDGPRDVREPGADGLANTADDGAIAQVVKPGPDGLLGTADDEITPLVGFTREIEIRDIGPIAAPASRDRQLPHGGRDAAVRSHHVPFRLCLTNDAGFSLVEALIATALSGMVIGGALHAFSDGMRLADTSRIISETNQSLQAGDEPHGPRLHPDRPGHSDRRHSDPDRRRGRGREPARARWR